MNNAMLSAFPLGENINPQGENCGLNKLEYFSAKAPKEIPSWFKPEIPSGRPKRMPFMDDVFGKESEHQHKDLFIQFWSDEEDQWEHNPETQPIPEDFKKEVLQYVKNHRSRNDEIEKYDEMIQLEKLLQWPIYWAKAMLYKLDQNPVISGGPKADRVTGELRMILHKMDSLERNYKFEIMDSKATEDLTAIRKMVSNLHDEIELPF